MLQSTSVPPDQDAYGIYVEAEYLNVVNRCGARIRRIATY